MIDLRSAGADPAPVLRALDLRPHPEGGHFRKAWPVLPPKGSGRGRVSPPDGGRERDLMLRRERQ